MDGEGLRDALTVRDLIARTIYTETRPKGPPFDMLKDSESVLFYRAADAVLELIWTFDRDE